MNPLRLGAAALLLVPLLVAPAPGRTGGCGETDYTADAAYFCLEAGSWDCRRAFERGELEDEDALQECVDALVDRCDSAQWPFDCRPNPLAREVDACLEALSFVDNLELDRSDIVECQLCTGDR